MRPRKPVKDAYKEAIIMARVMNTEFKENDSSKRIKSRRARTQIRGLRPNPIESNITHD